MRAVRTRIVVSLSLLLLAPAFGCARGNKEPGEGPTSTNEQSFEEFEARTYREPISGVYIVAGDTPIHDREALRAFFDRYVRPGALTLHTDGGVAPAQGCDATRLGQRAQVPYRADYRLFTAG